MEVVYVFSFDYRPLSLAFAFNHDVRSNVYDDKQYKWACVLRNLLGDSVEGLKPVFLYS